ncbi:hypothetical protein [Kitasatospora sp. MBT63]|uniref:hypothetical protein n=1 Tax=Kitasatospora sp. MBT63 TaxID=1444768 RepID=UPI00053AD27E|nr:hypothetical protein [Kitasatospora sp. MBT63]
MSILPSPLPAAGLPSLQIPLPAGRRRAVPALVPATVIVIILLARGYDIASATAAVIAIGAAARDLARTS